MNRIIIQLHFLYMTPTCTFFSHSSSTIVARETSSKFQLYNFLLMKNTCSTWLAYTLHALILVVCHANNMSILTNLRAFAISSWKWVTNRVFQLISTRDEKYQKISVGNFLRTSYLWRWRSSTYSELWYLACHEYKSSETRFAIYVGKHNSNMNN